jgi:hypothetical protein
MTPGPLESLSFKENENFELLKYIKYDLTLLSLKNIDDWLKSITYSWSARRDESIDILDVLKT